MHHFGLVIICTAIYGFLSKDATLEAFPFTFHCSSSHLLFISGFSQLSFEWINRLMTTDFFWFDIVLLHHFFNDARDAFNLGWSSTCSVL